MSSKYQYVPTDEKFHDEDISRSSTSDSLSNNTPENEDRSELIERIHRYSAKWMWLGHVVLLILSSTMFVSALFTRASTLRFVQQYSAYSPAAKAVEYQSVQFNNTMGVGSPYVGAGPDVDAAWRHISYDVGDQMITKDELKKVQMPESHLKVTDPKTGAEGWRVGLEVFHQLHCINLLRQFTYKDHYQPLGGDLGEDAAEVRMHLDHCLEILRMNVQCNADIGVFTLYLLPGDPLPWPELNSWHTCRNFDKVRDWAMENSVGIMEKPMQKEPTELSQM